MNISLMDFRYNSFDYGSSKFEHIFVKKRFNRMNEIMSVSNKRSSSNLIFPLKNYLQDDYVNFKPLKLSMILKIPNFW